MLEMGALLERWRMDEAAVRRRMYRAPTPRERERWHAWREAGRPRPRPRRWNGTPTLLANGPRHSGRVVLRRWLLSSQEVPPALNRERQAELKAAVQELPSQAGIDLSNWNWKAVRRLVEEPGQSRLNSIFRNALTCHDPIHMEAVGHGAPKSTILDHFADLDDPRMNAPARWWTSLPLPEPTICWPLPGST